MISCCIAVIHIKAACMSSSLSERALADVRHGTLQGHRSSRNFTIASFTMDGPLLVETRRFADARGAFSETYSARDFVACGLATEFVQDNFSISLPAGTIRGLHFQS